MEDGFAFVNGRLFGALLFFDAFLLELFEGFAIGFVLIAEAALLQSEILEGLFVKELDFGVHEEFAFLLVGFGEEPIGLFEMANGEDAGFERSDTGETPFGIGDGLGEAVFLVSGGSPLREEAIEEGLVDGDVFGGEEDGLAGEAGFESIH